MAKDPLSAMMAQAVAPGSVSAPGGKKVPPKGISKGKPPMPPAKGPPPPPPPAGAKKGFPAKGFQPKK
jgi:hypothetical protein